MSGLWQGIIYRKSNDFCITVVSDVAHMVHADPMTLGHKAHMVWGIAGVEQIFIRIEKLEPKIL